MERSVIHPRLEERWERMQVAFCITATILGVSLTTYLISLNAPAGTVTAANGKQADLPASIAGQLAVALAFSFFGLTLQRRKVIFRIIKGEIKPSRSEEIKYTYHVGLLFNISLPVVFFSLAGSAYSVLKGSYGNWPSGWTALAVLCSMVGYAAGKSSFVFWDWLSRRGAPEAEQALDAAIKALFLTTTLLFVGLRTNEYVLRSARLTIRKEIYFMARAIESNYAPLKYTRRNERALRGDIKSKHTRVAQSMREHGRALAAAPTEGEYKRICSSMLSGLLAALEGDMESLLKNAPEVSRSSRARQFARHVTPAAIMVIFAAVIPLLPGAGSAAGSVRVFLLATAALTLIPGSSSARPTIEGALSKALPGPQKP